MVIFLLLYYTGRRQARLTIVKKKSDSVSISSRISTSSIEKIVNKLKFMKYRDSTRQNYYGIWKTFNKFFIRLDRKPIHWDHHLILFVAYLVNEKKKSTTVRSYISAIKAVLKDNGIVLHPDEYLLSSLTKACRLHNDKVHQRHPIGRAMLTVLLKQVDKHYGRKNQCYLQTLYKAILSTMYFGLFRIGELTKSPHVVKARDVQIGSNKKKILLILRSSKTHGPGSKPQQIKISSKKTTKGAKEKYHCP